MVDQGDIILIDFDPTIGREQSGYRPAIVISKKRYNDFRKMALACPITSTHRELRLRIPLDDRTITQGDILCEQIKAVDLLARKFTIAEHAPSDILEKVVDAIQAIIAL